MRGLLAVECLYHQIVAGRKTQTRRSGGLEMINDSLLGWEPTDWVEIKTRSGKSILALEFMIPGIRSTVIHCAPRYKIGEVLYLKEPTYPASIRFKAGFVYKYDLAENARVPGLKFSNKLFMPASAARAFIRITGIRCERLLDISDEECIAEGIELYPLLGQASLTYTDYLCKGLQNHVVTPKESFLSLYKFANKVKEVENIFVWVYEFTYLKDHKHGH